VSIIAGLLLVSASLPGGLTAQEAPRRDWSQTLGIDLSYFTSKTSLAVLGVSGLATAWSWEETDESFPSLQRALEGSTLDIPLDIGNEFGNGYLVGGSTLGIMLAGSLAGNERVREYGTDLFRSFVYSAAVTGCLKHAVDRERPSGSSLSFPSGHTSSAFSTVPATWHHTGWKGGVPVTLLATLTAMGRMEENRHYLSDVIAGAAIGYVMGSAVISQRSKNNWRPQVTITPERVSLAWSF
jgi:membrane-associated phospholipid phosphatase